MPVGLSDGTWHEDYTTMVAMAMPSKPLQRVVITKPDVVTPPDIDQGMVVSPNEMRTNKELDAAELDPTTGLGLDISFKTPLEGLTEPAGAFNSPGGGEIPGNTEKAEIRPEPYGLNPPERQTPVPRPRLSQIVSDMWEGIKQGLSLTEAPEWAMDPVTGEFHTSPQAIERAADLANIMTFGPSVVAGKAADGTLGSFIGAKARNFDRSKYLNAKAMDAKGIDPDTIWKETGTFKGKDGRWRQEINDRPMILKENAFDVDKPKPENMELLKGKGWDSAGGGRDYDIWSVKQKAGLSAEEINKLPPREQVEAILGGLKETYAPITDFVDHPELFRAYPDLAKMKIAPLPQEFIDAGVKGQVSGNVIYLAPGNPDYLRSVLLHEMQHGVQHIEGFARGGSVQEFMSPKLKAQTERFNKAVEDSIKDIGLGDVVSKTMIRKFKRLLDPELSKTEKALLEGMLQLDKADLEVLGKKDAYQRLKTIAEGQIEIAKEREKHFELYRRLAGEVEARNVQTRMDMGTMDRFLQHPRATEDRPSFVQRTLGQTETIQHND